MFRGELMLNDAKEANDVDSVYQIALRKDDIYPCVAGIAHRHLCIPVSNVECERGFSIQNLIKTKLRNRLETYSLYSLIKLHIDGGCQKSFVFQSAYLKWRNMKTRSICGY